MYILKLLLKNTFQEIYSTKLIFIISIYSLYCLANLSLASEYNFTALEFTLLMISDHYYTIYILFLFYCLFLIGSNKNKNYPTLLRYKSYLNFLKYDFINNLLFVSFFIGVHVITSYIIGFKSLANSLNFSNYVYTETPVTLYTEIFSSPSIALVATILFLISGLSFFSIIYRFIELHTSKKSVIYIVIIVYFLNIIALQKNMDINMPYLFLNNYFILHHALNKYIVPSIICIILLTSTLLYWLIRKRWRIKQYV